MYNFIRSTYFQGVISGFSSGVVILNRDYIIYVINEAATRIFRRNRSECLSKNYKDIFQKVNRFQELQEMVEEVAVFRRPGWKLETTLPLQDDTQLYLTISASPLIYYGKLFGIFLEIKDVTHIYRFHEKEKQILEEKRAIEHQRTESLKYFSDAVAHQIRNPVTVIGGLTRRLMKNNLIQYNSKEYLCKILESGKRLEQIVEAVNQFTSIGGEAAEKVELSGMLQSIREQLQNEFPRLAENVTWHGLEDMGTIFGFPKQLHLTLYEICRNSLEAIKEKIGLITISRVDQDKTVLLQIIDTGCGIQTSTTLFLFDPFFTTHEKAIGMGLCKVQRVMNEHKGTVHLGPGDAGGTMVTLLFPRTLLMDDAPDITL